MKRLAGAPQNFMHASHALATDEFLLRSFIQLDQVGPAPADVMQSIMIHEEYYPYSSQDACMPTHKANIGFLSVQSPPWAKNRCRQQMGFLDKHSKKISTK